MVTFEQIQEENGRRPFEPFWVRLSDGETIYITEPNKAVVTRKEFVFTPDGRGLRWIPLDKINAAAVELQPKKAFKRAGLTNDGEGD